MRTPILAAAILTSMLAAATASAAPPFVDRGIVLPRHDWAFDFGLGIGHVDTTPSRTGPGLNIEGAVAVTEALELGLRTGIRFGDEAAIAGADHYGRLFDRQTFDDFGRTVANPEMRIRGRLVHTEIVELALEGRVVLPVNDGTFVGMEFGVPLLFHLGRIARLDTGVYVPVIFAHQTEADMSFPIDVWFQVTNRLWLGPMSGVVLRNPPNIPNVVDVSLGFGLGYQVTHALDFKTMFLMPAINHNDIGAFGVGAGIQVRIE
jgi:hypothetical protein